MSSKSANILFDDMFTIKDVDSARFERVSRLQAHSSNFGMDLSLDFHHEIYPLKPADNITVVLASSLSLAATTGEDRERETWRPDGRNDRGLDADYEYVMYGKIYKYDEGQYDRVTAYASFGGLLMALSGSHRHMSAIQLGDNVYLLIRRLA